MLSWHVIRLAGGQVKSPIVLPGSGKVMWLQDEPRVGIAAVVQTPHGLMTIATTHLSFVPVWNGVQLRKLCAELELTCRGPQVLLGDLNMPPPLPAGAVPLAVAGARSRPTRPSDPKIQLDHVLGQGALPPVKAVETPVLPVSDHRALLVEFAAPTTTR